jgi:hypothetical protein
MMIHMFRRDLIAARALLNGTEKIGVHRPK